MLIARPSRVLSQKYIQCISRDDLRPAPEAVIAAKLPLGDRSLTLYPRPYRWLCGNDTDPGRRDKTIWER